jgi:hypothetical protein
MCPNYPPKSQDCSQEGPICGAGACPLLSSYKGCIQHQESGDWADREGTVTEG